MTTRPTPHRGSERRAGDLLRGAGALVALLTLLIGLPALLYTLAGAPVPHRLPSPGQITNVLTRRDDGQLFLTCLLLLAWAGWACFAACVAVEAAAQLCGRGAPRLPVLGGAQRLAGHLVAAVAVAFLGAGPALTPAVPAHGSTALPLRAAVAAASFPASTTADLPPHAPAMPPGSTAQESPAAPAPRPAKTYTVQRGDTLWGIAEACLGDPERYPEIARLNYGRPQPDGRALTEAHWIYPGWTLLLPADATGLPAPAPSDTPDQHDEPRPDTPTTSPPDQGGSSGDGHQHSPPEATPTRTPVPSSTPTTSRPPPPGPSSQSSAGPTTGDTDHSDGMTLPGWAEAPLIAASVAGGLATALTVLRLRRRHGYQPSPPAPSTTGPQPASRLRRLADPTTVRGDDPGGPAPAAPSQHATDPRSRRLSEVEIGRRDDGPVTVDLLDLPGLAVIGPGADCVLRSLLADLLARARRYELQVLLDPPAAQRLLPGTVPDGDMLRRTDHAAAALMAAEIACVTRSRLLSETGVADYAGYRSACPEDPLPLLVLVIAAPPTPAGQLTALLTVGRRLGITALVLDAPPAGMATVTASADGQLLGAEPASLRGRLHGVRLAGLSAEDAGAVLSALVMAVPGDLPPLPTSELDPPAPPAETFAEDATAPSDEPEDPRRETEDEGSGTRRAPICVQLLGPTRITSWGEEISTGLRGTARELLAYYLLQPDGATAEAAIDALWPNADGERGRERFWTALGNLRSRLRGSTGDPEVQIIAKHGEHYRADPKLLDVDLWQFQAALADAQRATDPEAESAALQRAVDAYRGDLADGADYPWAEAAREDLHRRALDALVRLADLHHDRPQRAIALLDCALTLDPYAEEIYRRLIRLHAEMGRPDAARRACERLRDRLADLDLEPQPATLALLARLTDQGPRSSPRQRSSIAGNR